jgi:hypothetical protein
VRYLNPSEVEIVGAMRAPTPSEWRALRELLRASGVRIVVFVRHKGQRIVPHRFRLDAVEIPGEYHRTEAASPGGVGGWSAPSSPTDHG